MNTDRHLDVDGCRITYSCSNKAGSGHTVVLLCDQRLNRRAWRHVVDAIDDHATVISIDPSGIGDSGRRRKYSPAQHAAEISAILAAEDAGEIMLVAPGASFHAALCWARSIEGTAHEAGSELVLAGPLYAPPMRQQCVPPIFRPFIKQETFPDLAAATKAFQHTNTTFHADAALLEEVIAASLIGKHGAWRFNVDPFYESKFDYPDSASMTLAALASLTRTTSIVYGALSWTFSQSQLNAAKAIIPHDRIIRIENAGHHVALDQPKRFVEVLKHLLDARKRWK